MGLMGAVRARVGRGLVLAMGAAALGMLMPGAALRAHAETEAEAVRPMLETRGPVTNLPLPRYVSMKAGEGNARRGPSLQHRIDWVFTARDMPLQITAEHGHWRRVRDRDGAGGWMHYSLLSGVRTAIVEQDMAAMRQKPEAQARVLARAEAGSVVRLGRCLPDWCRISAQGQRGWVQKTALWGVAPEELRD